MATARPSLRKTTRRQKKSYREPDSESGSDFADPPPRRALPIRASRHLRDAYHEDTVTDSPSSSEVDVPIARQVQIVVPKRRKTRAIAQVRDTPFKSFKRRKTAHNDSTKSALIAKDNALPGIYTPIPAKSGKIPPWQNLEYQILLKVMQYAAYPLYTNASIDTVRWLLSTSEMCSSFHDACIGALMYSPPLLPTHRAHWLMDLLKASARDFDRDLVPEDMVSDRQVTRLATANHNRHMSLDYRRKIKCLSIDVKKVLVQKAGIDLTDMLHYTPLLKDLRLYHHHDSLAEKEIWAIPGNSRSGAPWSYDALFDALEYNKIELHAFEWNGRFLRNDANLSLFSKTRLHNQSFRKLRSISLRNLILPHAEKLVDHVTGTEVCDPEKLDNSDAQQLTSWRRILIDALTSLTDLKDLSIYTCNIFDNATIASLPAGLMHLTICNTPFIKSEGLNNYLSASGAHLTQLTLRSNQSLNLGFMPGLAVTTPYLQSLEVDLVYHDPTSYKDTEPLFDDLLPDGAPSWPTLLEAISVGPLRNLSTEDAEAFFQSLVDAAPSLPYLRTMSLRTLLKKASWRDRAQMRSKWDSKLHEIFDVRFNPEVSAPSQPQPDSKEHGRKSRRINNGTQDAIWQVQGHGRCHTVIFELSDQRPAQEQFREADFLDSEPEGDEEWNGKDDLVEAPRYSSRRYAW